MSVRRSVGGISSAVDGAGGVSGAGGALVAGRVCRSEAVDAVLGGRDAVCAGEDDSGAQDGGGAEDAVGRRAGVQGLGLWASEGEGCEERCCEED